MIKNFGVQNPSTFEQIQKMFAKLLPPVYGTDT